MILNLKKIEYFNYKGFMYRKIRGFRYIFNYNRFKFDLIKSKYCLFIFLGLYKNFSFFKNLISYNNLDSKKFLDIFYCNNSNLKIGAFTDNFNNIKLLIQGLDSVGLSVCVSMVKVKSNFVTSVFLAKLIIESKNFSFFFFKIFSVLFQHFRFLNIVKIFKYANFKSIII